jgi:hypothetical protein
MDRSCGWVELVGVCRRRQVTASAVRLARVQRLVESTRGSGWTAWVAEADGRWHVWIAADAGGTTDGMLPFFKALGSLVPRGCGVLDLAGRTRWVMTRGSVDLARDPDRTAVG